MGKLEFASTQVTVMQNELTALRPQLLETSDETEKLMIKIEQDTIQVGKTSHSSPGHTRDIHRS